jgi:hypothetical protein
VIALNLAHQLRVKPRRLGIYLSLNPGHQPLDLSLELA